MPLLYKGNDLRSSEKKCTLLNKTVEEELGSCQRNQYAFAQLLLSKEAEIDVLNNHGQEPLCRDRNHKPSDIKEFVSVDAESGNSHDNMHFGSSPSQSVSMNGHFTASFKQMDRRASVKQLPIQSPMYCML